MWIKYVDFLPSVTPHVTMGRRPQWFEDHSTCLYIYTAIGQAARQKLYFIYIYICMGVKLGR